jgi:endonuclease/exonuclease/phosphatase family metal-dependent hydrolase
VKLLHWNIHMWRDSAGADNRQAVAELISGISPEVVSLVEVDEPWGHPDNLQRLATDLGYGWVFIPAFEYRGEGGFGNALLVRGQVQAVQQWQLLPPRLYDGTEPSEQRAVLLTHVRVGQTDCWVGSTHLPRSEPALRAEAARRLVQLLTGLSAPWILCGDFNQPREAWTPPSSVVVPSSPMSTYPAGAPTDAIDYCVLDGVSADAHVLASEASDHLPLLIVAHTDA